MRSPLAAVVLAAALSAQNDAPAPGILWHTDLAAARADAAAQHKPLLLLFRCER